MCNPVLVGVAIGAAVGATTAAITGGDPLTGALIGGVTGGITGGISPGSLGFEVAGSTAIVDTAAYGVGSTIFPSLTASQAAMAGYATMAAGGGLAMGMLTPQQPDYSQFGYGAQPYQAYSSQHKQVTGSGGRQAAAVLASEIKQAKSLRKRQAEASADYGLGMDMAGTGLQIA